CQASRIQQSIANGNIAVPDAVEALALLYDRTPGSRNLFVLIGTRKKWNIGDDVPSIGYTIFPIKIEVEIAQGRIGVYITGIGIVLIGNKRPCR
uniref:hypothetical protein n=1 Tax=Pricia sp. TaxID=2268138 RepID=UPI003593901F